MNEDNTLKLSENFDVSKIDLPEIPEDIIFPDELNRYLREQIRYYVHENGMLQKNLSDVESQYNECKNKIVALESKLKSFESDGNVKLNSTQVASVKIVELSKKLREKNSEVEVLKTKISKLEHLIYELKERPEEIGDISLEGRHKSENETEETIKKLEEKLNSTANKLTEARNSNYQLKNDLKLANRWLQQEIGETFESLQTLSNSSSGWRGRSQIIIDLQQKNSELKEKLRNTPDKVSKTSLDLLSSKAESKISILSKENDDLKTRYDEIKKKLDISRARCRALETECTLLKSKSSMIKEQSERDQNIIATLSAQISGCRDLKNDLMKEKDNTISKIEKEKEVLTKQIEEYKETVKKFKSELEETSLKVESLSSLQSCHKCGNDIQLDKKLSILEAERQRLLELTELQNSRLTAEREAHSKTQSMLRYEKQRAAKAEARMELESSTTRSGYSTTSCSIRTLDFTLKDQLELAEENIKALKTRLEIEQLERQTDLQEFAKVLQSIDSKTYCSDT